jgi:AcrR family transcriptional regulator
VAEATGQRTLRKDARDSISRINAAALEIFLAKGLDASLNEIARAAGVSVGTLYNRFGSREGVIDAVIPEIAARKLQELAEQVMAGPTPRERLQAFVDGMIEIQHSNPALNDAILRRFPEATALIGVCDRTADLGQRLVRDAHGDGSLATTFTEDDLIALLWMAGTASSEPSAPAAWRRILERALDSAWTHR